MKNNCSTVIVQDPIEALALTRRRASLIILITFQSRISNLLVACSHEKQQCRVIPSKCDLLQAYPFLLRISIEPQKTILKSFLWQDYNEPKAGILISIQRIVFNRYIYICIYIQGKSLGEVLPLLELLKTRISVAYANRVPFPTRAGSNVADVIKTSGETKKKRDQSTRTRLILIGT